MRRELLALVVAAATLASAIVPAAACPGYKPLASSDQQTQQQAQADSQSQTSTQ